jgi:hypothetical protein
MRKRGSVDSVGAALMAALGLLGACAGKTNGSPSGATKDAASRGDETKDGAAGDVTVDEAARSDGDVANGDIANGDVATNGDVANSDTDKANAEAGRTTCLPCLNPSPVLVGGIDTGYDTCASNIAPYYTAHEGGPTLRRRAVVDCPSLLPRGDGGVSCTSTYPQGPTCSDNECADAGLGTRATCELQGECQVGFPAMLFTCVCVAGCVRDSDCATGNICLCGDPIGHCVRATCSSGSSCAPGCECIETNEARIYAPSGSSYEPSFDCQAPLDGCFGSADCPPGGTNGFAACVDDGKSHVCVPAGSTGCQNAARAFLVRRRARLAASAERSDWTAGELVPDVRALPASVRDRVAAHWTRIGLMEHASIAAFARFVMHLLALGAPAEIVRASQEAMGDETEHTRLAFALGSACEGRPVGPGPLDIDGALDSFNVDDFVATLLREGCIGETMAAIEAQEALQDATDPAVHRVLSTLARDELRHAELAWRTLAWLIASERVDRGRLSDEVARAFAEAPSAPPAIAPEEDLRAFGIVGGGRRFELHLLAIARVIQPCAQVLLRDCGESGPRPTAKTAGRRL